MSALQYIFYSLLVLPFIFLPQGDCSPNTNYWRITFQDSFTDIDEQSADHPEDQCISRRNDLFDDQLCDPSCYRGTGALEKNIHGTKGKAICMIAWNKEAYCNSINKFYEDQGVLINESFFRRIDSQHKNLNKCLWKPYHYYNYIDNQIDQQRNDQLKGQGVNSFSADMVEVKNGRLFLYAMRSPYQNSFCKTEFVSPIGPMDHPFYPLRLQGTACPFISGAVESNRRGNEIYAPHDGLPKRLDQSVGFSQTYGRFEVRAKIPQTIGAWPAIWMLPDNDFKTGYSEIDLMESWSKSPNEIQTNLHGQSYLNNQKYRQENPVKYRNSDFLFWDQFHVYTLEWQKNYVKFFIDGNLIQTVSDQQLIKSYLDHEGNQQTQNNNQTNNTQMMDTKHPINLAAVIPQTSMFFIFNLTTTATNKSELNYFLDPNYFNQFIPIQMEIDYVRAYEKCDLNFNTTTIPSYCMVLDKQDQVDDNNHSAQGQRVANQMVIYPNPINHQTQTELNIAIESMQACSAAVIRILNFNGQNISTRKLDLTTADYNETTDRGVQYKLVVNLSELVNLVAGNYVIDVLMESCQPWKGQQQNQPQTGELQAPPKFTQKLIIL